MAKVLAIYSTIFLFYMFALSEQVKIDSIDIKPDIYKEIDDFKLLYFTGWTLGLQIIFLIAAIVDEAAILLRLPLKVQKLASRSRAFLFNVLTFPCSLLVMTVFWSLWHIDRELIFPKVVDEFFPSWLNHTLHTFIAVPLIIEIFLPKKYNFVKFKDAAIVLVLYTTVYQLLYMYVYIRHGVWLYPIYKKMNWFQRLAFPVGQLAVALVYQKIGIELQDWKGRNLRRKIK